MKPIFVSLVSIFLLLSCSGMSDAEKAAALVDSARSLVIAGQLNEAKIRLDSVHYSYPKCVAQRRLAKDLQDSVVFIEAQRTLSYSDSLLAIVQAQADPLLKKFTYEKQEQYEDHGRYVHRLLRTDKNLERCYLQVYITDDYQAMVRSYYAGNSELIQSSIEMQAADDNQQFSGNEHHFTLPTSPAHRSILSLHNDRSLELLNFVSSHMGDRIRVNLVGMRGSKPANYVYYLSDNEKNAIQDTYQLGIFMMDIHKLEEAIRIANLQINKYQKNHCESR